MAGTAQNLAPMWKELGKLINPDPPSSFHMSVYLGTDGDETTRADNLAHMWHANFFGMNWPNKKLCTEIMIQMVSKMTDSSRSEAILNLLLQQKTNLLTDIIAQALLKMDFMSKLDGQVLVMKLRFQE